VRGDGADLLAPRGGLGEAALLRRRKLRQRVDLAALPGEHGKLLGAGDLASDIASNLGVERLLGLPGFAIGAIE
jgi:hypothetical protein